MKFQVVFEGQVVQVTPAAEPIDPESLEAHLDDLMDELTKLSAEDATVSATLSAGQVEISVSVPAGSFEGAVEKGNAVIRAAIHAAGGFTPQWSVDWVSVKTSKAETMEADRSFVDA